MSDATRPRTMIAVTIGVGPYYAEMARLAAERVRRFTGLPTRVLGDAEYRAHVDPALAARIGPIASCLLKTKLFELCPGYDDVLYFDADLVSLAPWDPRALGGTERFVCVRDSWYLDFIQADASALGMPVERYFNAGFFIASREAHAAPLEVVHRRLPEIQGRGARFFDQSALNLVFHELDVPMRFLDRRYNFLGWALDTEASRVVPALMAHCVRRHVRNADKDSTMQALRGTLPLPPSRARTIDSAIAAELADTVVRLRVPGRPEVPIELRADFTVGLGWTADAPFWMPFTGTRGPELTFLARDHVVCTLRRGVDGVWRGVFPMGHTAPGGARPALAGADWARPTTPQRLARLARRIAPAALRAPLARSLLGRAVELRAER